MKYPWLDDYCTAKVGAVKDYKVEWEATRYMISGKMFAMHGQDNEGRSIITLKLEPSYGQFLRDEHEDVRPGYYMNKEHWNSVDLAGNVPEDVLKNMVDESHRLIFESLSKKLRKEITDSYK